MHVLLIYCFLSLDVEDAGDERETATSLRTSRPTTTAANTANSNPVRNSLVKLLMKSSATPTDLATPPDADTRARREVCTFLCLYSNLCLE